MLPMYRLPQGYTMNDIPIRFFEKRMPLRINSPSLYIAVLFTSFLVLPAKGQSTLLPQNYTYQVELYNWLETISVDDVTVPVGGDVFWDQTYNSTETAARMWIESLGDGDNKRGFDRSTMSEPRWYVLDDGNGFGIEGYGRSVGDNRVRLPRVEDPSGGIQGMATQAAWWYKWDIPTSGGGQGNPLYKHSGIGTRALVIAAVDMMMHQECIETFEPNCSDGWGDRTDFIGGYLIAAAETVLHTGELLSEPTLGAFFDGMELLVDRMLELKAKDLASNMDGKAIEGCAFAWEAADVHAPSHPIKQKCEDLGRLVLFGYTDGQIDTEPYKIDSDTGIFYLEGLVREGDGPETTYNGRSMDHLTVARNVTFGEPEWDFLDGVLTRMCDFMMTQFYEQPSQDGFPHYQTPSGYSNRTEGGMKTPQDTPWAQMSLAYLYDECAPLAWGWKFNKDYIPETASQLAYTAQIAMDQIRDVPEHSEIPESWEQKEPWPYKTPNVPEGVTDWYDKLRTIIDSEAYYHVNHPERDITLSRTFPDDSEAMDNWQNQVQWWSRRDGIPSEEFSYFIEATAFSGTFGGYYSGKIEAFWREDQGPVLLSLREPTKSGYSWEGVHLWRVDHVWGYDETNSPFSWGRVNGSKEEASSSARTVTWDKEGQRLTVVSPMEGSGQESGSEINGSVTLTKIFTGLSNGLEVTTQIESDGSDEINELWHTLPLYEGGTFIDLQQMPEQMVVEYLSGASWQTLGSSLQTVSKVRVGHDWGSGFVYTTITFDEAVPVRLMAADTELDFQRVHLLQIDLHENSGQAVAMPALTELTYKITTSDIIEEPLPPVANDVAVTTLIDNPVAVTLQATDLNGDPLTYSVASSPLNGMLTGTAPQLIYTPNAGFEGNDSFTFTASDGSAESNAGTVTIEIRSLNDAQALWPFEGSGSAVADVSGNSNTGTLVGGERVSDGYIDNGIAFDGDGDYIDLGGMDVQGPGLTLAAWIRIEDFEVSDARIISKATSSANDDHWWMLSMIEEDSAIRLRFRLKTDAGGTSTLIAEDGILESDTWIHAVATYDGSEMRLYQDGFEVGSRGKAGTIAVDAGVNAFIGMNPGSASSAFTGKIDEVRIYDRGLSADEVEALYNQSGSIGDGGNIGPTINLSSPGEGSMYTEGEAIEITAAASDADGTVDKVEFFAGTDKLGEDTNGGDGWNYSWTEATVGNHSLTARATDNDNASRRSLPVLVEVFSETSTEDEEENDLHRPESFVLYQNYPNPFLDTTTISFDVPHRSHVKISVYDLSGRVVSTLLDRTLQSGKHRLTLESADLSSGVYLIQMQTQDQLFSRKVILRK